MKKYKWLSEERLSIDYDKYATNAKNNFFSSEKTASKSYSRSSFQQDLGKVIHYSQFRRMAHKTQVYSFPDDQARNRLTHSIEVNYIAQQLLRLFLSRLDRNFENQKEKVLSKEYITFRDSFSDLLEISCLVHDIGHPPFAHTGEKFLSGQDVIGKEFDSNVQNLRFLTTLSATGKSYNMDLCSASIDSSLKMKHCELVSFNNRDSNNSDKFNEYEKQYIEKISEKCGTRVTKRRVNQLIKTMGYERHKIKFPDDDEVNILHPCVFFMNMADDISYIVSDIQDSFKVNDIKLSDIISLFEKYDIKPVDGNYKELKHKNWQALEREVTENTNKFKSHLIRFFILEVDAVFNAFFGKIKQCKVANIISDLPLLLSLFATTKSMDNSLEKEFGNLLYCGKRGKNIENFKKNLYRDYILKSKQVLEDNARARLILAELYELLFIEEKEEEGFLSTFSKKVVYLSEESRLEIMEHYRKYKEDENRSFQQFRNEVKRAWTDYLAGMTDYYAESKLKEIKKSFIAIESVNGKKAS
jgi:dGTPase